MFSSLVGDVEGEKSKNNVRVLCADKLTKSKEPIVYRDEYNIKFFGFEKKFVMDSAKFSKIIAKLKKFKILTRKKRCIKPKIIPNFYLTNFHTKEYLDGLKDIKKLGHIIEINFRNYIQNIPLVNKLSDENLVKIIDKVILRGYRFQTGGSVLAGELAMIYGFCFNIGGGQHHCASTQGGGWCVYADIQICIENLCFQQRVEKVLIIDLDAHQGNGYELDKVNKKYPSIPPENIYIIDLYNKNKYPSDKLAKAGINIQGELSGYISNEEYLNQVIESLKKSKQEFTPDFVVYNAGTDILEGDTLGGFQISADTIIERDYLVMKWFISQHIPIVYMTSGGYSKDNLLTPRGSATVIGESINNMYKKLKLSELGEFNFAKYNEKEGDKMLYAPKLDLDNDPDYELREIKPVEIPKLERVDMKLVEKLVEKGYEETLAIEAMTHARNHMGRAVNYLVNKYGVPKNDKKEDDEKKVVQKVEEEGELVEEHT